MLNFIKFTAFVIINFHKLKMNIDNNKEILQQIDKMPIFDDKNNKKEMTKIILKSLSQMGYTKTVKKLFQESKIEGET